MIEEKILQEEEGRKSRKKGSEEKEEPEWKNKEEIVSILFNLHKHSNTYFIKHDNLRQDYRIPKKGYSILPSTCVSIPLL